MIRLPLANSSTQPHSAARFLSLACFFAALVGGGMLGATSRASAFSKEAAIENCREAVGKPFVRACMDRLGGRSEENRSKCRAQASPTMKACVMAAYMRSNSRANVPIALHKDGKPPEGEAGANAFIRAGFAPPPRTIADIAVILDNEKPDPAALARLKADADASPPSRLSNIDLAKFYYDRGNARSLLGRNRDALADGENALKAAQTANDGYFTQRVRQLMGLQIFALGDLKGSMRLGQSMIKDADRPGQKGYLFGAYRWGAHAMIQMGDLRQAEDALQRNLSLIREARTSGHPGWRTTYAIYGRSWEGDVEATRAIVFDARGKFADAAAAYVKARQWTLAFIPDLKNLKNGPAESQMRWVADTTLLDVARMKARQGRLAEAEADARSALLARLKDQGKYNPLTTKFVLGLSDILVEQGRYAEAERLTKSALDIQRTLGIADDTQTSAQILSQLGTIEVLQRKLPEAVAVYSDLDRAIAGWEVHRREVLELNGSRITALFASGEVQAGMAAAQAMFKQELERKGEAHFDTASARGIVALGHLKAGNEAEAIREFKLAIPALTAAIRENADDDDATIVAGRRDRLQSILEVYIGLMAKPPHATVEAAAETFSLADAIRGRSVQQALSASSARASFKDPVLAELARREQDLSKQVNAQLGMLNNVLAGSSAARDERAVRDLRSSVDKLRSERDAARADITKRFPSYADLVDPKPPNVDQIKAILAPGEAVLSFYFGRDASFVWAVPKDGAMAFAAIPLTSSELEAKVRVLREALEPQAAMVSDIPAFDLKLGFELYSLLMKPVEAGWKQSKSLIVVTNGALGLLPLPLLPTAQAEVESDHEQLFSSYRGVPWLARSHAVTMVPSVAALRTLRQLPQGKPGRGELIAFGDPYFSKAQVSDAATTDGRVQRVDADVATMRGVPLRRRSSSKLDGVDSADLALLPRLPDTADELRLIALALQADPSKALNLGKDANEEAVKIANLSGFKIVAFATHGLVPGELNGLMQPALALSAPDVAGVEGDGLLTMEEILSLKLDADWVVLSACNTGSGAGAGAEAASGLGRAFFYAGTRAILVTNWSVHSQSARELVADLFKRQADDPKLARGDALRQAMMALVDGPGYVGADGKTEFTYAHPLFWAPYSIIGDGGLR